MITCRWIEHGSSEYGDVVQLRRRVLRLPLGLDFTEAQLAAELADHHLAAYDGDALVGCLLLTDRGDSVVQMRQVAVEPSRQGQGIGAQLVKASEEKARALKYARMILHARDTAVPFYEKLGYTCVGEPFIEVNIPHREMERSLERG
jgi:predicted GNAT family N-acyltransferase